MITQTASVTVEARQRPHRRKRTCHHCSQSFFKSEHLARHIRSHTKEKPFTCSICAKSYGRQDSLQRHMRSHVHAQNNDAISITEVNANIEQDDGGVIDVLIDSTLGKEQATNLPTGVSLDGSCSAWNNRVDFNTDPAIISASCPSQDLSNVDLLSFDVPSLDPSSQLEADFDVPALGSSLAAAIFDWEWLTGDRPENLQASGLEKASDLGRKSGFDDPPPQAIGFAEKIQQTWYTNITPTRTAIPERRQSQQDTVDESYRESLALRLHVQPPESSLPSADFLNLCIKLYFSKFHPVFPIIHAPSFQPSSENTLVLLSICSVGALFLGTPSAASQGRKIFQRLNKAILASWETVINRGHAESLSLAQAAVIGQTFAMSSGHPTDICLAESFHGTVIAWARRGGMFQVRETLNDLAAIDASNVDKHWRAWIRAEETVRIVIALHIHDAGFSSIFHHEPLLRHSPSRLPFCCSEKGFSLPSAERWLTFVKDASLSESSRFLDFATLASIQAHIQELRANLLGPEQVSRIREQLISWVDNQAQESHWRKCDPFCLPILWHQCFIQVYTNLDELEQWIGRDGFAAVERVNGLVHEWASGHEAKLCVVHALLIQKHIETLTSRAEPAIHVSRALFYSALVIYAYLKAKPQSQVFVLSQADLSLPEIQLSQLDDHVRVNQSVTTISIDYSMVCNALDLLRRLGHFDIARKLALIIEPLLEGHIRL